MRYDGTLLAIDLPDDADADEITAILDTHYPGYSRLVDPESVRAARRAMKDLPGWATWSAADVAGHVDGVLQGRNKAEIEAWVEANVASIATAKTALKLVGGELVELRQICAAMAQAIIYLRDVVIG